MDTPQNPENNSPEENLGPASANEPQDTQQAPTTREAASETPVMTPAETPQASGGNGTKQGSKNYKQFMGVAVAIVIVLLAGGYLYITNKNKSSNLVASNPAASTSAAALLGIQKKDPVARVNGQDVSWNDYERSLEQVVQSASSAGANLQDPTIQSRIKDQAMTTLINTEVLLQEAKKQGITASDTAVQAQFDKVEQQVGGKDKLDQMLKQLNLSQADLMKSLSDQFIINTYITSAVDLSTIDVTEAEIQDQYNKLASSSTGTNTPSLDSVHDAIKSQLQSQKQQQAISNLLDSLKHKATIETLI